MIADHDQFKGSYINAIIIKLCIITQFLTTLTTATSIINMYNRAIDYIERRAIAFYNNGA